MLSDDITLTYICKRCGDRLPHHIGKRERSEVEQSYKQSAAWARRQGWHVTDKPGAVFCPQHKAEQEFIKREAEKETAVLFKQLRQVQKTGFTSRKVAELLMQNGYIFLSGPRENIPFNCYHLTEKATEFITENLSFPVRLDGYSFE